MHDEDVVMTIASMHSIPRQLHKKKITDATSAAECDVNHGVITHKSEIHKARKPRVKSSFKQKVKNRKRSSGIPNNILTKKTIVKKSPSLGDSSENDQANLFPQNHERFQWQKSSVARNHEKDEDICKKIQLLHQQSRRRRRFHLELFKKNLSNCSNDAARKYRMLPLQNRIHDLCLASQTPLNTFVRRQYIAQALRAKFMSLHGYEQNLRVVSQRVN